MCRKEIRNKYLMEEHRDSHVRKDLLVVHIGKRLKVLLGTKY